MDWGPLDQLPPSPRQIAERLSDDSKPILLRWQVLIHDVERIHRKIFMGRVWVFIATTTAVRMTWGAVNFHGIAVGATAGVALLVALFALHRACVVSWRRILFDRRQLTTQAR